MSGSLGDGMRPRCGTQFYAAAAAAATSTPTSTAASRGLLMDVETTVQFLSTARPPCCQAAALCDIQRPSNDLDSDLEQPSDDVDAVT